jgi:DNA-binding XRE family transcriptional regulator
MTPAEKLAATKKAEDKGVSKTGRRGKGATFACKLREVRISVGLVQEDVAGACDLAIQTVANSEAGMGISLITAWKLADFFGKKIEDLWQPLED